MLSGADDATETIELAPIGPHLFEWATMTRRSATASVRGHGRPGFEDPFGHQPMLPCDGSEFAVLSATTDGDGSEAVPPEIGRQVIGAEVPVEVVGDLDTARPA